MTRSRVSVGEDKCVGLIGGKTQTDITGMDGLYLQ
jgi:hypothetical protein